MALWLSGRGRLGWLIVPILLLLLSGVNSWVAFHVFRA
jgi:hypothetical protein